MRLSTLKDLIVVASLFAGVAFAGASVVRAAGAPVHDTAPTAASACTPSSSVVSLSADTPDAPVEPALQC